MVFSKFKIPITVSVVLTMTIILFGLFFSIFGCAKGIPLSELGFVKSTPYPIESKSPALTDIAAKEDKESEGLKDTYDNMLVKERIKRRTYLIGPGDVLRLKVWMREDLSKEGVVQDDGAFFVPLAGNLKAEGKTVTDFQKELTEALAEYIRSPQVDIEIHTYNSKFFYLIGQIREPGHYPITASTTVMQAITTGKGFTDKANLGQAYLIHKNQIVPVDFVALFEKGRMENNIHLDDGDVIFIPNVEFARVFVLGEVLRPSAVPVRTRNISVSEAISMAGGFNEVTAYKSNIKIIRGDLANPQVFTLNYTEVLKGNIADIPVLQPGDIVYVPSSGIAKWDRVMGLILPNLSRLVVDAAAIDSLTNR